MSQIDVIKESIQNEQLIRESSTDKVLKGEYLIKDSIDKLYDLRTVKDVENIIRIEDFN